MIDLLLILIILLSGAYGWARGLIHGLLDLVRWIGSVLLAFLLYQPVARLFSLATGWSDIWSRPAGFVLVLVGASLLLYLLGGLFIKHLLPEDIQKISLNRILGVFPGVFTGLILAAVSASMLFSLPFAGGFQDSLNKSRLARPLAVYSDEIETALGPVFEDAVAETLTRRLTNYPGSDETVELPYRETDFRPRPDLEAEMLDLINRERTQNGLPPLKADPEMREVARRHSADMFTRGYFSHNTPEKKDPFDRMQELKVRYRTAGENLALAPTLKIAHTGLMNSRGHRANILRPQFGRVGIGILDSRRGLMVTQNFRN